MNQPKQGVLAERSFSVVEGGARPGVNQLAFSADGELMAAGRTDMTVDLFVQGKYYRSFGVSTDDEKVRPTQRIRGLAFGKQADRLIMASADEVRCIEFDDSAPAWTVVPPRTFGFLVSSPLCISMSIGNYVAAAFDNGSLGVWSPEGERIFLRRESNSPRCISFAERDDLLIGTDGFSLCSWDAIDGKPKLKKLLPERAYYSACWQKGSVVAVRSLSSVCLMDIEDGGVRWRGPAGVGLPLLAFQADTGRLAIPEEHAVSIVDIDGRELDRRELKGEAVTSVAFDPASGYVVLGKADGEIDFVYFGT